MGKNNRSVICVALFSREGLKNFRPLSLLRQLMVGQLQSVEGNISRRSGLSIGRYHQHSAEVLDFDKSPINYLKVGMAESLLYIYRQSRWQA